MKKDASRRTFAKLFAAGAAGSTLLAQRALPPAPGNFSRPVAADRSPFEGKLEFTRKPVANRVEPFPLSQVRLLPGSAFHDAQEWNRGYMQRLSADRLLYTSRVNAGLPTAGAKPLGGWEQPENGQRSSE